LTAADSNNQAVNIAQAIPDDWNKAEALTDVGRALMSGGPHRPSCYGRSLLTDVASMVAWDSSSGGWSRLALAPSVINGETLLSAATNLERGEVVYEVDRTS
jgi:hypothetical protein